MSNNKVLGPYQAGTQGSVSYLGNRIYPAQDILQLELALPDLQQRYKSLAEDSQWSHLARINAIVYQAVNTFFANLGALFIPLPLTTRMISSPGALYGREKINYTTDTVPLKLQWFEQPKEVFLSESSQIYLELALLQQKVEHVFSIYNSFRKEHSDATHLAEFHHIEYEGHVSAEHNVEIAESCIKSVLQALLCSAEESLSYFLLPLQLRNLQEAATAQTLFSRTTFRDCLTALFDDTKDERYLDFTLDERFGMWEEIRLTEIFGMSLAISGFPLLEVPFYHAEERGSDPPCAINTDLIWQGYREIAGAGQRIASLEELEAKAQIFSLPPEDYYPYLLSRRLPTFSPSSGFGLGWERLIQGILCLPAIWLACPFPRTHLGVIP